MSTIRPILTLAILVLAGGGAAAQEMSRSTCPTSADQLLATLRSGAAAIAVDPFRAIEYADWAERCRAQIESFDKKKCSTNFVKHVSQQKKIYNNGGSLGFIMSNAEYLAQHPDAIDMPEFLRRGLQPGWREEADRRGYKYIEFFSPSVGFHNQDDPATAYRRLVFYIPDDRGYQKWIQFVPPQRQNNNIERVYHVDLIAVDKDENGNLRQFHNQYVRSSVDAPFTQKGGLDRCLSCHANGPRHIRPWPGYVTEGNITASEMSKLMFAAQNSNWGKAVDVSALGPGIGVKQSCADCHDPANYGAGYDEAGYIGHQFNLGQIRSKMVTTLQMPPSFLRQDKYKTLKQTIDRLNDLSKADAMKIKGETNRDYAALFDAMKSNGLITTAQHEQSIRLLHEARQEQEANYEALVRDRTDTVKAWLLGNGADGCPSPEAP